MFIRNLLIFFLLCPLANAFAQNDCVDAIIVCGNSNSNGLTVNGIGTQELSTNLTCSGRENNSIWLKLNIKLGGTLGFTLTPKSSDLGEDFDFFIFGPVTSCNDLGISIRCSTTNPLASGQSDNLTGLNATETDTAEGPGPDGNSFLKQLTVFGGETYYLVIDRPHGNSDFDIQWSGTATFNPPPTFDLPAGTVINMEECDSDGVIDQRTGFDLTVNDPVIIGSQSDVAVTYHTSSNDAIIGENAIPNPDSFRNTQNPQTLYARITNVLNDCYDFREFTIRVTGLIDFPITEYSVCDDTQVGTDTDSITLFDLHDVTTTLQPTTDVSGFTIAYYESRSDASSNTSPLPRFYTNTIPEQQPLFIKVSNAEGCYVIQEILLIVKPLPATVSATLSQCDFDFSADGKTLFNLNEADVYFVNNDPALSVRYYANTSDALGEQNALTEYTNTSNPQNIVARVDSSMTQCYRLNTLTLNVTSGGIREKTLYACDDLQTENGIATFNLREADFAAPATAEITYYRTPQDAALEQNAVTTPEAYQNEILYTDKLYVRIEDANNCLGMGILNLLVYKLPNIVSESDGNDYVCSNLPNEFIIIDAALVEGSPEDFDYLWQLDGQPYAASTYMIAVNQPGTYTVEVVNKNACRKVRTIMVHPSNEAIVQHVEVSDFIVDNNTIRIELSPESIGNYEFSLNNAEGPYRTDPIFENVESGFHTVYIRDINGCGILEQMVTVLGLPKFFTPNGDGVHDIWRIEGLDRPEFKNTTVHIFDRHGKFVKEIATGSTDGWDGTLNGKQMPSDDYWYVVSLFDGRTARGHFSLKR